MPCIFRCIIGVEMHQTEVQISCESAKPEVPLITSDVLCTCPCLPSCVECSRRSEANTAQTNGHKTKRSQYFDKYQMVTKSFSSNSAACTSSNVSNVRFKVCVAALGGACLNNLPSFNSLLCLSAMLCLSRKKTVFNVSLLALNAIEKDAPIYKLAWPQSSENAT